MASKMNDWELVGPVLYDRAVMPHGITGRLPTSPRSVDEAIENFRRHSNRTTIDGTRFYSVYFRDLFFSELRLQDGSVVPIPHQPIRSLILRDGKDPYFIVCVQEFDPREANPTFRVRGYVDGLTGRIDGMPDAAFRSEAAFERTPEGILTARQDPLSVIQRDRLYEVRRLSAGR